MVGVVFIIFAVTLLLDCPIGIAVAITALSAAFINPTLPSTAPYVFRSMVTALDATSLLAVPLFILSGNIMAKGGISKKLFDFFAYFIGKLTAGLPIAVIVTCLFYGAICGSGPATVAAVGAMCIPFLTDLGYDKPFVVAMVAVAGGLGVIIPPSIPFIVYGLSAGVSVGKIFIAGILPGILIGLCLMVYAFYYCKKKGEDKERLHAKVDELRAGGFWNMFKNSVWALITPIIILGGIYTGVVTPTEAACISVDYALIISLFVYKTLSFKDLGTIARATVNSAAPALLVVSAATVFGRVLTLMGAPQAIAAAILSTFSSKVAILLIINIFLLFVGMVMETLSAIMILVPIFLPIVTDLGVDPIHFGVIMVVNLAIGFVTPPVGLNLYVASAMTKMPVMTIAKKAIPFMIAFFVALMVITFVPEISMLLIS